MSAPDVKHLINGILRDLTVGERGWSIRKILNSDPVVPFGRDDLPPSIELQIVLGTPAGDEIGPVYFSRSSPETDAIVATASQLQDAFVEWYTGEPLPPCPGHVHPLSPVDTEDGPSWVCPADSAHHHELISVNGSDGDES
ncbi:hypothetical protein Ae406Ps2_6425 [Pseudonocardia sp. Ae406_Ps2]|nr:hypothetical protein Ae168Ps1_6455c [Pseudonocardia sp. Ae168_Ps1]OLL69812.1 hypothetical protein Ae150APs1_6274c [Pseudonocardia sp. Ae150A_Ps1]OLL69937.1 hypothetical protein Ae263Ps1_6405c [Pseudonocardia sp. Ae263_Ps1]OLL89576.1 hypothetical protein Ae406Ps2_6425 [Pseudonocardia sp. Ae406_Ps2]